MMQVENGIGKEMMSFIRKARSEERIGNVGNYEYMYSKVTYIDRHECFIKNECCSVVDLTQSITTLICSACQRMSYHRVLICILCSSMI